MSELERMLTERRESNQAQANARRLTIEREANRNRTIEATNEAKRQQALSLGREVVALLGSSGVARQTIWEVEQIRRSQLPRSLVTSKTRDSDVRYTRAGSGWMIYSKFFDLSAYSGGITRLYGISGSGVTFTFSQESSALYPNHAVNTDNRKEHGLFGPTYYEDPDAMLASIKHGLFQNGILSLIDGSGPLRADS